MLNGSNGSTTVKEADSIEEKLEELLDFAEKNGLAELSWEEEGKKVSFRRSGSAPQEEIPTPGEIPAEPVDTDVIIKSPMVGTFRRGGSKDRPPLVMEGNHVKPGDRLGIVDCMKIPTDVVSYCKGKIKKIMVEDGQAVEYGQPLFALIQDEADAPAENG